jgi:hypothetical protein
MKNPKQPDQTRRTFVKTVTYVAPAILTLKAAPALAQNGSHVHEEGHDHENCECHQ